MQSLLMCATQFTSFHTTFCFGAGRHLVICDPHGHLPSDCFKQRHTKQNSCLHDLHVMCLHLSACSMMNPHFGQARMLGHCTSFIFFIGAACKIKEVSFLQRWSPTHSHKQYQQNSKTRTFCCVQLMHLTRLLDTSALMQ